jgi:chaperone LolA
MANPRPISTLAMTLALLCACAHAQEPAIMKTVRASYGGDKAIACDFDLSIYRHARESRESVSGHATMAPGNKYRVEIGKSVWVSNGATYWQYSAGSGQVIIKNLRDMDDAQQPSHLVTKYLQKRLYRVKSEAPSEICVESVADPTERRAPVKSVTLTVEAATGVVKTLVAIDKSDDTSTYTFRNTKLGGPVPASMFTFEAPKGAQVLDMRE